MPNEQTTLLNIASTITGTRMLGPGFRSIVWVQGCMLNCPGCISPEWIPLIPNRLVSPSELAYELLKNPTITGLTISGGEPMLQSEGLAILIHEMKKIRDIDTICFTGFTLDRLLIQPPSPGIETLLNELDVLIDGPFIQKLNDNQGMRGSRNQRVIYVSDRLKNVDFENFPRHAELVIQNGYIHLVGVPPLDLKGSLDHIEGNSLFKNRRFQHVRP
jgi:anaerobic ribonucleoside-triphosphate reductase activating protein